jgi:soluble cytochrome b562
MPERNADRLTLSPQLNMKETQGRHRSISRENHSLLLVEAHIERSKNMSISAISAGSTSQMSGSNPMAQMKQNFDNLGSALSSGNIDDARKAFAKLQKNAPSGGDGKTPSEIDDLKKALDSGDLKAAQEAYSKIQEKMSQGPPAGGQPPSGPPPGEPKDTVELSSKSNASTTSTSDTGTYDKMDTNKDGTVTAQERLEYLMTQGQGTDTTASSSTEDAASSSSKNSAKSSAVVSNTYDKKDTNKDGTVTAQEKSHYATKLTSDTTSSTSPYSGKSSIKTYA